VQINELAERSGIPVATIKYYVREGLLPGGDRTGYNRVAYAESHLHRLRLVRTLLEVGRLPIATAKQVVAAVDDPAPSVHSSLGVAQRAVAEGSVTDVLEVARALGHPDLADLLTAYRDAAEQLAALEIQWLAKASGNLDQLAERAVVGTVLGDALLAATRREAQRDASRAEFGQDPQG
jgi:DNA-binding transcriptional MerR regulator